MHILTKMCFKYFSKTTICVSYKNTDNDIHVDVFGIWISTLKTNTNNITYMYIPLLAIQKK